MSKKGQKYGGSDPKSGASTSNGKPSSSNNNASNSNGVPANAWSQPLRTKPNSSQGPPPGMGKGRGQGSASNSSGSTNNSNSSLQDSLRERFIGLMLNLVGHKVIVSQTNGAVFEGVFHTFTPFSTLPSDRRNKYAFKACRVIKPPQTSDSEDQPQALDQSTVVISAEKVACITAKSLRIDTFACISSNGSAPQKDADSFRTDTEISGGKGGRARDLVAATAWTTGSGSSRADALMGALEDKDKGPRRKPFNNSNNNSSLKGNIGEWDQFRANQELFNVNATFDENLYTTELDKTQIDNKKIAEAERLAREIENTTSANIHIAEERGQALQVDYDEEDLYSGVLKDSNSKSVGEELLGKEKRDSLKPSQSQPSAKKMNYAAAAAKADPTPSKGSSPELKTTKPKESNKPESDAPKANIQVDTPSKKFDNKDDEGVTEKEGKVAKQWQSESQQAKSAVEKGPEDSVGISKETVPPGKTHNMKTEAEKGDIEASENVESADKSNAKVTSKLNANAKEFTLNPSAKTFTPGGAPANIASSAPDSSFVDPNLALHVGQVASHMPGPHYMHGHMNQSGMMPIMNQPFPGGVRYPGGYGGMDQQHVAPIQHHQVQNMVGPGRSSGAASPAPGSVDEEVSQAQQDVDIAQPQTSSQPQQASQQCQTAQQQQQGQTAQQQQHPQQVPVPYGVPPPGAYYGGGMPMHTRGPGGPHPGYHPQFVGGPQQMPVGPAGAPYRHMYPMQPGAMPPNAQVRGPGAPYYGGPVSPVPYPPGGYVGHGMVDEDTNFRGGRGRSGRSGGRRPNRGGRNRGGRGYNSYQHGGRQSGPSQGQTNSAENWSAAEAGNDGNDVSAVDPAQAMPQEETSSAKQ